MKHILIIPSWYATKEEPVIGSFFHEHALSMQAAGFQVGVIYPEVRQLRRMKFSLLRKNYFQTSCQLEGPLATCRLHGWNLFPKMMQRQMEAWCSYAEKLMKIYVAKYGRPDLIHAQSSVWAGIAANRIAKKWQIPYCITEHASMFQSDTLFAWSRPYIQEAFDQAGAVVAVSQALKEKLKNYTEATIEVIPNLVFTEHFKPRTSRQEGPFRFLSIGHLVPRKNMHLLIEAFSHISDAELIIGGDGPEKRRLLQLVQRLGLKQVHFLGALSRKEAAQAFQEADAFVLASQHETFGVVCIEALASGIPVIATRCGGTEEIEPLAHLVPVGNLPELTAAMKQIREQQFNPQLLHQSAKERFGAEAVSAQYIKLYNQLN